MKRILFGIIFSSLFISTGFAWQPAGGKIMTPWAKEISPADVWPEYPRPMMVRPYWKNLNGLWDYAVTDRNAAGPQNWDGEILVPFAIESALSGVGKTVGTDKCLWYRRSFTLSGGWQHKAVLLHFDAVDWETTVWVNGKQVGTHQGGYDPFTFDITKALLEAGPQELVVRVWDPTSDGYQPRGKQVREPKGIWYTSVTGIWQTVWIETVPRTHIDRLKITPDIDNQQVRVEVAVLGVNPETHLNDKYAVSVIAKDRGREIAAVSGTCFSGPLTLKIPNPKLWSPDNPFLYDLQVRLVQESRTIDEVTSYFGMRKMEVKKEDSGMNRLFLNNAPLFQYGPLDQGWWPDGLYTPPSEEAMKYDLEVIKKLGMNMLRKHVKVEPRRLYYWCDKLGLLVWQDMPSGDRFVGQGGKDIDRGAQSARCFEQEMKAMIDTLYNHPSIVMWVPFNEGWGQFDTVRITQWIKQYDPTRLVNNASGWQDRSVGDVIDMHKYPGPDMPQPEDNRAAVLGEFGGLGLPIKNHTWQDEKNWGYRSFEDREKLTDAYLNLIDQMVPLIARGLAAAVYTQTTDVEIEVNGLLTYDRIILKMDRDKLMRAHRKLYAPPPPFRIITPTAMLGKVQWKYAARRPDDTWRTLDFDDSGWKTGTGGFGKDNPYANTTWNTNDIYIRRKFEYKPQSRDSQVYLSIYHDEDAWVYLNDVNIATLEKFTSDYIDIPLNEQAQKALKKGENVLAIHCRQTTGGQFIDAGLFEMLKDSN